MIHRSLPAMSVILSMLMVHAVAAREAAPAGTPAAPAAAGGTEPPSAPAPSASPDAGVSAMPHAGLAPPPAVSPAAASPCEIRIVTSDRNSYSLNEGQVVIAGGIAGALLTGVLDGIAAAKAAKANKAIQNQSKIIFGEAFSFKTWRRPRSIHPGNGISI